MFRSRGRNLIGWRGWGARRAARAYGSDPLGYLRALVDDGRDVAVFPIGTRRAYVANHPDIVRLVLETNAANYRKTRKRRPVFGRGLLTSEGEAWRMQRLATGRAFDRNQLGEHCVIAARTLKPCLESWNEHAGTDRSFDVSNDVIHFSIAFVSRALFGVSPEGHARDLADAMEILIGRKPRAMEWLGACGRQYRGALHSVAAVVSRIVDQAPSPGHPDEPRLLAALRELESKRGVPLRDQVSTFLAAGHETVANFLCWTLYLLGSHAEERERLRRETCGFATETPADLLQLAEAPYLTAVLAESLRLFPPAWLITRESVQDDRWRETKVPAGALILVSPYLLHRDPRYWEEPHRFVPARFLTGAGAPQRGTYLPFGSGPRACVARQLAMVEAGVFLALLLREFDFETPSEKHPVPQPAFTLRPGGGVWLRLRHRRCGGSTHVIQRAR